MFVGISSTMEGQNFIWPAFKQVHLLICTNSVAQVALFLQEMDKLLQKFGGANSTLFQHCLQYSCEMHSDMAIANDVEVCAQTITSLIKEALIHCAGVRESVTACEDARPHDAPGDRGDSHQRRHARASEGERGRFPRRWQILSIITTAFPLHELFPSSITIPPLRCFGLE